MNHDRIVVALLFVFVPSMVLNWNESPSPAFADILARLRHECDPANPEADYFLSQRSMQTERKREAIIRDCSMIGAKLLADVNRQLARELDEEMRGMLIVIAAALGDVDSIEPAARLMSWSDFPAVRISAAKTLRRLQDRRTFEWFLGAMNDDHFVVNGGCGTLREKFYPVRSIARLALRDLIARHPGDRSMQHLSGPLEGMESTESFEDLSRQMREAKIRELEAMAEAELRLKIGK